MISWKYSFKRLKEEHEIANKKKNALDNLYTTGKISQATRDSFNKDIIAAIDEIEKQQKELLDKMTSKTQELQDQIKTLEILLANYEIQHAVGEIEEDTYSREISLLNTGLDTAKNELVTIQQAVSTLTGPAVVAPEAPVAPEPIAPAPTIEIPAPVAPQIEAAPVIEAPVEVVPVIECAPIEALPLSDPKADAAVEAAPTVEEAAPVEVAPVEAAPAETVVAVAVVEAPVVEETVAVVEAAAVVEATPEPQ